MGRLQSIQILRLLAVALVVIAHSYDSATYGAVGVDVFFVISGFIITKIARDKSAGRFLWDRARRIYPIYYLATIPYLFSALAQERLTLGKAFVSITLWPVVGQFQHPMLSVGWSLSFEMLFYLAAAVVIARPALALWLLAGFVLAFLGAQWTHWPVLTFLGCPLIMEFLLGVVIARDGGSSPRRGAVALIGGVICLAVLIPQANWIHDVDHLLATANPARALLWGIPAAMIVWGGLQLEPLISGPVAAFFVYLGNASYSIYLVHFWGIVFFAAFVPKGIAGLLAIGLGVAFYRYVEQPLLRRLNRRPGRKPLLPLQPVAIPAE